MKQMKLKIPKDTLLQLFIVLGTEQDGSVSGTVKLPSQEHGTFKLEFSASLPKESTKQLVAEKPQEVKQPVVEEPRSKPQPTKTGKEESRDGHEETTSST